MGMAPKEVAAVAPRPLRLSALENPHRKDLGLVQVAMRHTPSRWLFQRYQAVALVLQGYPYSAVSQIIGRSLATISHYIQARPLMAMPNRGWVITAQTIAANVLR